MSEFNDSIEVFLDNKEVFNGLIKTDESIGASFEKVEVSLEEGQRHTIMFSVINSPNDYSFSFKNCPEFLYVWKTNKVWHHEFRNEILKLE